MSSFPVRCFVQTAWLWLAARNEAATILLVPSTINNTSLLYGEGMEGKRECWMGRRIGGTSREMPPVKNCRNKATNVKQQKDDLSEGRGGYRDAQAIKIYHRETKTIPIFTENAKI